MLLPGSAYKPEVASCKAPQFVRHSCRILSVSALAFLTSTPGALCHERAHDIFQQVLQMERVSGNLEQERTVQDPVQLRELLAGQGVDVALNILVFGIAAVCVLMTLTFVAAVVAASVAEFRRGETGRNGLSHRT